MEEKLYLLAKVIKKNNCELKDLLDLFYEETASFNDKENLKEYYNKIKKRFYKITKMLSRNFSQLEETKESIEAQLEEFANETNAPTKTKEGFKKRIENKTYKTFFEEHYNSNKKQYDDFKKCILEMYKKHKFEKVYLDHMKSKNVCELVEEFPEPTYCYCNKVSEGEMVSCEGEFCTKEWFHVSCLNEEIKKHFVCKECRKLNRELNEIDIKIKRLN